MQADLNFPFAQGPATAELVPVCPGVHWLRMPLPFSLNHINLWVLDDGDGCAIIDTGIHDDTTRGAWQSILNQHLRGRPVTRVLATHCHPDHIGAAGWLCEQWQAPFWITQGEWMQANLGQARNGGVSQDAMAAHFKRLGLPSSRIRRMTRMQGYFQRMVGPLPAAYERVAGADTLNIGGRDWQVLIGRGHSPEHACFYCEELNVLIGGDQVLPNITPTIGVTAEEPNGNPLGLFLHSLDAFYGLPPDCLVLPAHELPYRQLHFRVTQLKLHHEERCALLLRACGDPLAATEAAQAMFAHRNLSGFDIMLALGETLAHLHLLMRQGAVERFTDPDGVYRYRAT